jgi:hypothetical protein
LKELQGLGLSIELLNKSLTEELPPTSSVPTGEIDWNDMLDISDFDEDSDDASLLLESDEDSDEEIIDSTAKVSEENTKISDSESDEDSDEDSHKEKQ